MHPTDSLRYNAAARRHGAATWQDAAASRYVAALVTVGAAVLIAGCGGEPVATVTPSSSSQRPATTSPSTSTSPSPSPSPSSPPKVTKAADGRKLSACRDLRCEVEVKSGDTIRFAAKYDIQAFHIQQISKQTLYFATAGDDGGVRGYVGGEGSVSTADAHVEVRPVGKKRMILKFRPR